MLYKPTYCCNCGEKIEVTDTLPWKKSGRFCDVCRQEFSFQEFLPKVFILICVVFGLFGLGGYLKTIEPANTVALKQNKLPIKENAVKTDLKSDSAQNSNLQINQNNVPFDDSNLSSKANKNVVEKQKSESQTAQIELVYFCGAATKKGTPCSRKVKGGGRCWQHKGQEALLAQEKLLITQ